MVNRLCQLAVRWRLALLLLLGVVCYVNALNAPFVFDDLQGIAENPALRSLWPIRGVMDCAPDETPWGRPFVALSLALNFAVSGLSTWSYHLYNLAVHVAAAMVLFGLTRKIIQVAPGTKRLRSSADGLALAVAFIWFSHPLATNVVTYTVQRAESMMSLCFLLTLYFTVRSGETSSRWLRVGGIVSCAAGMLCKETMAAAPIAAVLLDWVVLAKPWRDVWRERRLYYAGLAASWAVLAYLIWRWPRTTTVGFDGGYGSLEYFLMQWQIIVHYLRLAICPIGLALDYDWPQVGSIVRALPHGLFLTALLALSLWGIKRRALWGFPASLFFLVLAPSSSFLPVHTSVAAEHRMYLPLATVVAVCVVAGHLALQRAGIAWKRAGAEVSGVVLALTVVVTFATLTIARNHVFRSDITIWRDVVYKQPWNARAWSNLGGRLFLKERKLEARECFEHAVELDPEFADAIGNLGVVIGQMGELAEGIMLLERSLELEPESLANRMNLALFFHDAGDMNKSIENYLLLLERDPWHGHANLNLAIILTNRLEHLAALEHVNRVLRFSPDHPGALKLRSALLIIIGTR